jgi:hypothetical protein
MNRPSELIPDTCSFLHRGVELHLHATNNNILPTLLLQAWILFCFTLFFFRSFWIALTDARSGLPCLCWMQKQRRSMGGNEISARWRGFLEESRDLEGGGEIDQGPGPPWSSERRWLFHLYHISYRINAIMNQKTVPFCDHHPEGVHKLQENVESWWSQISFSV